MKPYPEHSQRIFGLELSGLFDLGWPLEVTSGPNF